MKGTSGNVPQRRNRRRPVADRLLARIVVTDSDCWEWQGSRNNGYGFIRVDYRLVGAHRVSYQEFVGEIPAGLTLDHLCRNPPCINPAHLEPVTNAENIRRSAVLRTHCVRGHLLAGDNLYPSSVRRGRRVCRPCNQERSRLQRQAEGRVRPPTGVVCRRGHVLAEVGTYGKNRVCAVCDAARTAAYRARRAAPTPAESVAS